MAVSLRTVRSVISETSAMNMATPALGPSFGVAPAGTWTWMSLFSKRLASMPSAAARFLTMRQSRLRALLHHVAELARQDEPAGARDAGRLDEQDVAAHGRPGEAGGHAGHAGAHRGLALEARRAEDRHEVVARDPDRPALPFGNAHRGVPQRLADLAFEIPHAGFAGVAAG